MGTVCFVAMLDYLFMATDHGMWYTHGRRESYWVLYVDWMITCPIILYVLGRFAAFTPGNQYLQLFFIELSLAFGFFAAYTDDPSRFAYFVLALICFLPVWRIVFEATGSAELSADPGLLNKAKIIVLLLWLGYPIIWILATGLNKICVDSEIISLAFLDVTTKALFALLVMLYSDTLSEPPPPNLTPLGGLGAMPAAKAGAQPSGLPGMLTGASKI